MHLFTFALSLLYLGCVECLQFVLSIMPQTKARQEQKIDKAWEMLEADASIVFMSVLGIDCRSRMARENPRVKLIRAELDRRIAANKTVQNAPCALSREAKRAAGVQFGNSKFKKARVDAPSSSSSGSQQTSLLTFVDNPDLKNSGSSFRKVLSHSLAHAAYDLCETEWENVVKQIEVEMHMGEEEISEFARHVQFLEKSKHCKFSDQHSDLTQYIIKASQSMLKANGDIDEVKVLRFLSLFYFVCNSRDFKESWLEIASLSSSKEIRTEVTKAVGDTYLVNWRKFPVSTATGCRLGIPDGSTKEQNNIKHIQLALVNMNTLLDNIHVMTDWRKIQSLTQAIEMQSFMLKRMWCDIFDLPSASPEVFTEKSKPYIPQAYVKKPCDVLGKRLRAMAETLQSGRHLLAKADSVGISLFSDRHTEHVGCELRKSIDGPHWPHVLSPYAD